MQHSHITQNVIIQQTPIKDKNVNQARILSNFERVIIFSVLEVANLVANNTSPSFDIVYGIHQSANNLEVHDVAKLKRFLVFFKTLSSMKP